MLAKPKRKTRIDKFPLTLHPTGQYCKIIKGKLYYFGVDKRKALGRYLEQVAYLHTGKGTKPDSATNSLSIKTFRNLYLEHQESMAAIGEVKLHYVYDQISLLKDFVKLSCAKTKTIEEHRIPNRRLKFIRQSTKLT